MENSYRVSVEAHGPGRIVRDTLAAAVRTARSSETPAASLEGLRYPHRQDSASVVTTYGGGYGSEKGSLIADFGTNAALAERYAGVVREKIAQHPRSGMRASVNILGS